MKKIFFIATLSIFFISFLFGQNTDSFFDRYDRFLNTYTDNGNVDFDRLKTDSELLNQIYESIGKVNLEGKNGSFKKAFLIKAYNIIVIKQEQVFYPIKSPNEINGFFDNITHMVAGKENTLNALEKKYLLREFHDPRVHLVLVCGAKRCLKLLKKAYRPEKLDDQIDEQVKAILNDPDFLIVSDDKSNIELSEIFKWYQEDFIGSSSNILEYINQYHKDKLSEESLISYYEYDWSINTMGQDDE